MNAAPRLPLIATLETLLQLRGPRDVVITTMSAARETPNLSQHPLDFHFVPSAMGGGPPLGLGLALAQPLREVFVLTGDGSLLMNLGSLVTVVSSGATNITICVLDNGVFEVTGGQKTAATDVGVDYAGLARAAGFPNVAHFSDLDDMRRRLQHVLKQLGPRFLWLQVEPQTSQFELTAPGPINERIARFREALAC
jgi:thiamine pyrophosphate-dependent acetolactate synthase large subunit-like protein